MPIIIDNGEPLVDLKEKCPDLLSFPGTDRTRMERCSLARVSVMKRLNLAIRLLPPGLTLKLDNAWRPQRFQEETFQRYLSFFEKKYPSWDPSRLAAEVKKFVHPSRGKYASGHLTGGALDIVLADRKSGKKLPMDSRKLTFQENALTLQPKLPLHIRKNREILFRALSKAGFANYYREYWHWSYGDIRWAEKAGRKKAVFGIFREPLHFKCGKR